MELLDTIAAISTPIGNGGVGVIRISGDSALEICKNFVKTANLDLSDISDRTMNFCKIFSSDGSQIDEALFCIFRAPNSYTGENVIELFCHGGYVLCSNVVKSAIFYGARQAKQGEFTKRAFLNGKLNLSKSEAIADLIHAKTDHEVKISAGNLRGNLDDKIQKIKDEILKITSQILANIDFPDEDIDEVTYHNIDSVLKKIVQDVTNLLSTSKSGNIIKNGVNIAIVGAPNVGKSSLLNAIVCENRAIVTDIPGTTRDIIVEQVNLNGYLFNFYDTAGIHDNWRDEIERIGIQLSEKAIDSAQVVLFIVDISRNITNQELDLLKNIKTRKPVVILNNKCDIQTHFCNDSRLVELNKNQLDISALTGIGIDKLGDVLVDILNLKSINLQEPIICNPRHENILLRSHSLLNETLELIGNRVPIDVCLDNLEECLQVLGEFQGQSVSDIIIKDIFSRFCVGK